MMAHSTLVLGHERLENFGDDDEHERKTSDGNSKAWGLHRDAGGGVILADKCLIDGIFQPKPSD